MTEPGGCTAVMACPFSLTWTKVSTETFPSVEGGPIVSRTEFSGLGEILLPWGHLLDCLFRKYSFKQDFELIRPRANIEAKFKRHLK